MVLTPEAHPSVFKDLRQDHEADFEIEPAVASSNAPPSDLDPTTAAWLTYLRPESPSPVNPFHGNADVRITRARVWMVGMTTTSDNNKHDVHLTHLGQERFTTRTNKPFPTLDPNVPGSDYITHDPVPVHCVYNAEGLKYDPVKRKFLTGSFEGAWGLVDSSIGLPNPGTVPKNCLYAPIGPFGQWRIKVRPQDNPGLDLSGLNMIVIEFHGFARRLDEEPGSVES